MSADPAVPAVEMRQLLEAVIAVIDLPFNAEHGEHDAFRQAQRDRVIEAVSVLTFALQTSPGRTTRDRAGIAIEQLQRYASRPLPYKGQPGSRIHQRLEYVLPPLDGAQ